MKETIGLSLLLCFSIPTFYLAVKGRIPLGLTISLLVFSVFVALAATNYDTISKLTWAGLTVETAKREITGAKETALEEIAKKVEDQKESIRLLISNANSTSDKIERQKEALSDLIRKASALQTKIENQKEKLIGLNESAERTCPSGKPA
jgi:peptidoglycan hydrolase CwlO-like protein